MSAEKTHQKGPLMPYLYATLQLCSSVAALQPGVVMLDSQQCG